MLPLSYIVICELYFIEYFIDRAPTLTCTASLHFPFLLFAAVGVVCNCEVGSGNRFEANFSLNVLLVPYSLDLLGKREIYKQLYIISLKVTI